MKGAEIYLKHPRISPQDKALLMRAGDIEGMSLSDFVIRSSVNAARDVVERTKKIGLSERDSLRVLEILKNPSKSNYGIARKLSPIKPSSNMAL